MRDFIESLSILTEIVLVINADELIDESR
jgi:hypothetical protein